MLTYFIISILCSIGIAVMFVEKAPSYPMRYYNVHIRKIIRKISGKVGYKYRGKRPEDVMLCAVCFSFWATLITDFVMLCITKSYFLWPLSGFAAAGILYLIFQFFKSLEKK